MEIKEIETIFFGQYKVLKNENNIKFIKLY